MDTDYFQSALRHLEILFNITMSAERKDLYRAALKEIPNSLWVPGILSVAATARFFPSVAEIGEACVPGVAETEELDPWTKRWIKIQRPWTERLAKFVQPEISAAPAPLLIPGPRDPLSESEWMLLGQPNFKKLLLTIEEKIKQVEAKRQEMRSRNCGKASVRIGTVGKWCRDQLAMKLREAS